VRINQIFAIRFIHSEEERKSPYDKVITPLGLAVNLTDGVMFTTTREGRTVKLSSGQVVDTDRYVGHDRPLADRPTSDSEFNNGSLNGLTDIVNHVYYHTLAYEAGEDERLMGGATVYSGTQVTFRKTTPTRVGEQTVIMEYLTNDGLVEDTLTYEIPSGMTSIQPLRLRFRSVEGSTAFSTLPEDDEAAYEPYLFTPQGEGLWVIEFVHDYGEGMHAVEDGEILAYVRIGAVDRYLPPVKDTRPPVTGGVH